ncbi:SDR family NAD(P)-dependent oxidoreductase [soil metagenome]
MASTDTAAYLETISEAIKSVDNHVIDFDGRVAIVTGAAGGLGRLYALELAARGAKIMVNDAGGPVDGRETSPGAAESVAMEIRAMGGQAMSHNADVSDESQVAAMIEQILARWGRIDILINNAGILRDSAFVDTRVEDIQKVMDVHLMGSILCSKAVWPHMLAAGYGRILMISSIGGLYGAPGRAGYGTAKMGVIGLMHVLQKEGETRGIRINSLSPAAATRMTEDLPEDLRALADPHAITPAAIFLVSDVAPANTILAAAAGGYSRIILYDTPGISLAREDWTPEAIAAGFEAISDPADAVHYQDGLSHFMKFITRAAAHQYTPAAKSLAAAICKEDGEKRHPQQGERS